MNFFRDQSANSTYENFDASIYDQVSDCKQHASPCDVYNRPFTSSEYEALETIFKGIDTALGTCDDIGTLYNIYLKSQAEEPNNSSNRNATQMELFQHLPIEQWNGEDCMDWASSVCRLRHFETSEVYLRNFRNVTGKALLQFSQQEFCAVAGDLYGDVFCRDFQSLSIKKTEAKGYQAQPNPLEETRCSPDWSIHDEYRSSPFYCYGNDCLEMSSDDFQDFDCYIPEDKTSNTVPAHIVDLDLQTHRNMDTESDDEDVALSICRNYESGPPESASYAVNKKVRSKSRNGERGPKIWEFLMRLLVDPSTNPELIRWNDESNATFVLSQPAVIAHLWGARSNKPNLSANNFARALRYHYNKGALAAVSEKHYMYKCGPKSLKYLNDLKKGSSSYACRI